MSFGRWTPDAHANTIAVTANTASASASLPPTTGEAVLITNTTGYLAFVAVGPVATVNDLPCPAGSQTVLQCGRYASAVSAILQAGTGSILFTRGSLGAN